MRRRRRSSAAPRLRRCPARGSGARAAGRASRGRAAAELHRAFTGATDGRRYSTLDPGAYAWVHATLAMAPVDAQRFFGHPMSTSELNEHYAQMCGIGRILGVRERDLPPTWPEFERYYREMDAGFGPNETISTLFETIDTVRKPFSRMSDCRWPKIQRGHSSAQMFLIRTPVVPLRPGPASAAPALLRGTALVQSIRPHRQPRPLRPGCPQRLRLGESPVPMRAIGKLNVWLRTHPWAYRFFVRS
ncbi:oxygenase MpaB family protein [Amycolatopsis sp. NPDC054798]